MKVISIETPFPLTDEQKKMIKRELFPVLGKFEIHTVLNSRLAGGIVARIGYKIYDASFKRKLNNIKSQLLSEELYISDDVDPTKALRSFISTAKNSITSGTTVIEKRELGEVVSVGDGVAWLKGLEHLKSGELVRFGTGHLGMAFSLDKEKIGTMIFSQESIVKEGDWVDALGIPASVPVGEELLGRVINPLGAPVDGKGPINAKQRRPIEMKAPGIVDREPVSVPLETGIKVIDALIPIGRGQRELIIGDRNTGKTAIAIDTIINQKGKGVICVYAAIGQKSSSIARTLKKLRELGASDYTVVVAAPAYAPAAVKYISAYVACTIAEYFMYRGQDTLVVYDDLTKHARAYREISLLVKHPPGREAYPGDIFYIHSRLLERSARLSREKGGGSMTALPIVEALAGDITGYIPTNLISITDGQIYLERELFLSGIRPAVNIGLSVSRVGGNAQCPAMKELGVPLRLFLAQYRELASFAQLGVELDPETRSRLIRGEHLLELMKQKQFSPMPMHEEIISIYLGTKGYFDKFPLSEVATREKQIISKIKSIAPKLVNYIAEKQTLDRTITEKIDQIAASK
ncbi:F0F1 ATP synthase subunit alpha [bacterium]|nr:F0F1 ATP synthase subunit alpha [bacterium]